MKDGTLSPLALRSTHFFLCDVIGYKEKIERNRKAALYSTGKIFQSHTMSDITLFKGLMRMGCNYTKALLTKVSLRCSTPKLLKVL